MIFQKTQLKQGYFISISNEDCHGFAW